MMRMTEADEIGSPRQELTGAKGLTGADGSQKGTDGR